MTDKYTNQRGRLSPPGKWLEKILWERWLLPTKSQERVLLHLIEPGEPRLFIQLLGEGRYRTSLSNSEHSPGWSTKIASTSLVSSGFLEIDEEMSATCVESIEAYHITDKGREALVQIRIYEKLEEQRKREAQDIIQGLGRLRKIFGISRPAK